MYFAVFIFNQSIKQASNQSSFICVSLSGNKNPYYLGLKESKIERKYVKKNMQRQRNHKHMFLVQFADVQFAD